MTDKQETREEQEGQGVEAPVVIAMTQKEAAKVISLLGLDASGTATALGYRLVAKLSEALARTRPGDRMRL